MAKYSNHVAAVSEDEIALVEQETPECCDLCARVTGHLSRHHLIPRSQQKKERMKRYYTRHEMREKIAFVCPDCLAQLRVLFTEKQLAETYNTLDAIKLEPRMAKFLGWVKRQRVSFELA